MDEGAKQANLESAARTGYGTVANQASRIAELEAALRDCTAFVAIHVDRWTRDNGGVMHETHRELLGRIGRLTGRPDLLQRLEPKN